MSRESQSKSLIRQLTNMCNAREERRLITLSDREVAEEFCKFDMSDTQKDAIHEVTCRLWERQGAFIQSWCRDEDVSDFFNPLYARVAEELEAWLKKPNEDFQVFTSRCADTVLKSWERFGRRLQTGDTKLSREDFFNRRFSYWRSHSPVYSARELTVETEDGMELDLNRVSDVVDLPVHEQIENRTLDAHIQHSIAKLPEGSHAVLQLRFNDDLSFRCISEELRMTYDSVMSLYKSGLKSVKRDLIKAGFRMVTIAAIVGRLQRAAEAGIVTSVSSGANASTGISLIPATPNAVMVSKSWLVGFAGQTIAAGTIATLATLSIIAISASNPQSEKALSQTIALTPSPMAPTTGESAAAPAAALPKELEVQGPVIGATDVSSLETKTPVIVQSDPAPPVQPNITQTVETEPTPTVQVAVEETDPKIRGGFPLYPKTGRVHRIGLDDQTWMEFSYCPGTSDLRGFWIDRTEITQALWDFVAAKSDLIANPSYWKGRSCPVERVTPILAEHFCRAFSREVGIPVRLLTEKEWNHAVAAGKHLSEQQMLFNDDFPKAEDVWKYAWILGRSRGTTHPVGQLDANDWNVFDLFGNVFEIVRGDAGGYRVAGGSWNSKPVWCKEGYLSDWKTNQKDHGTGFRVVIDADAEATR